MAIIDVDHFKNYNDHCGHAEGDLVLRRIAQVLADSIKRPGDLVARYGGEEFVVLLPDTHADAATCLGKEIVARIEALQIPHPCSPMSASITVSLGGVTQTPNGSEPDPRFFQQADSALYVAKADGRNRTEWRKLTA